MTVRRPHFLTESAWALISPASAKAIALTAIVLSPLTGLAGDLSVNFTDGTFGILERFLGPNDNPRDQRPEFTVNVENGRAVHVAPAAAPGPRLTGFLEPPARHKPIPSDVTIEWNLPSVSELQPLAQGNGVAIVGHYIRGAYDFANRRGDWQGGMFGDWWGGVFKSGDNLLAVLRNGNDNRVAVPVQAKRSLGFRMVKEGTKLALWLDEDSSGWREVGRAEIALNPGGQPTIAMSHFRVLDTSGVPVRVSVDRMVWRSPDSAWPR